MGKIILRISFVMFIAWTDFWKLPNSMKQIFSWETNSFSASQESPRILWRLEFYCCIHNRPPLVSLLIQNKPVHGFLHILNSILILSFDLGLGLPSGFFSQVFPSKYLYAPLLSYKHSAPPPISEIFRHEVESLRIPKPQHLFRVRSRCIPTGITPVSRAQVLG